MQPAEPKGLSQGRFKCRQHRSERSSGGALLSQRPSRAQHEFAGDGAVGAQSAWDTAQKKIAVRLSATALELLEHEAGTRFVRATQLRRFKLGIELLRGAECVLQPPR